MIHKSLDQTLAVVLQERVVRPGHRGAGGEQNERVQERQVPGIERALEARVRRRHRRPVPAEQLVAVVIRVLAGQERRIEIGPEPGDEEHHLRGDEQDHPVAQMQLHDPGVIAGLRLDDDVPPPGDHHVDDAEHAGDGDERRAAAHPVHAAHGDQKRRKRADERPRARIDQMIIVLLGVCFGHSRLRRLRSISQHARYRAASPLFSATVDRLPQRPAPAAAWPERTCRTA